MTNQTRVSIPGYVTGTWSIDPVHSDVSFTVRHMMVSKVRGKFHGVNGSIVLAADPLESEVTAEIDMASIDTGNEQRDEHIRSADFFEVTRYPTMTFRSTALRAEGDGFVVTGDLTLRGVTRQVDLQLEMNGFTKDPFGGTRAGFTAVGQINRRDFGITIDMPMDGGGAVVGDRIQVLLEIEAVLAQPAPEAMAS
ncbi:MAG TPA: YceI family protein [Acidimicrobiales bacterium]|nr:YceI family protein [Acidimicrobiales bacterium]